MALDLPRLANATLHVAAPGKLQVSELGFQART